MNKVIKSCQSSDQRKLYDSGEINIWWTLSYNCNFNCDYCWNDNKNEVIGDGDIFKVLCFITYLTTILNKKVSLTLYGGEPTIVPNFFPMLRDLQKCYKLTLITNTSFDVEFVSNLNKYNPGMVICCSYHDSLSVSHYLKNVVLLSQYHTVECRIMISDLNSKSEKIIDLLNRLSKLKENFDITITPKLIYHPDFTISDHTLDLLNSYNNGEEITIEYEDGEIEKTTSTKMLLNGQHYFKFYKCYCGSNNLAIDSNGDLYYCDTFKKEKHRKIMNVRDVTYTFEEPLFLKSPIVCDKELCDCHLYVKKEKMIKIKQLHGSYNFF